MHRLPIRQSSSTITGAACGGSSTPPMPTPPERCTLAPIWAHDPTVAQVSTIVLAPDAGADVHVARHHDRRPGSRNEPQRADAPGHDPHAGRLVVRLQRDLVGVLERPELDRLHRRQLEEAAGSPASATGARRRRRRRRSRPPAPRPGRAGRWPRGTAADASRVAGRELGPALPQLVDLGFEVGHQPAETSCSTTGRQCRGEGTTAPGTFARSSARRNVSRASRSGESSMARRAARRARHPDARASPRCARSARAGRRGRC